ncbi:MAG: glycoside hydrolase family 16 protein [Kiritimatiellae bacterium]|nr:glycoside hydrolase family 16 protein [Kiritimatiellia bacterium]
MTAGNLSGTAAALSLGAWMVFTSALPAGAEAPPTAVPIPPSYALVWSDEFEDSGAFPGARWNAVAYRESEKLIFEHEASRVTEGRLRMELRSDRGGGVRAGRVNTLGRMERGPAYYEVRARLDPSPGVRATIRLMSSSMGRHMENPGKGGADVQLMRVEPSPRRLFQGVYWNPYVGTRMPVSDLPSGRPEEDFGRRLSGLDQEGDWIEITRPPRAAGGIVDASLIRAVDPAEDGFHVYSLLWTDDRYQFFVDGQPTHSIREGLSGVPLFFEAWIAGRAEPGRDGAQSAALELDYVRIYAPPEREATGESES